MRCCSADSLASQVCSSAVRVTASAPCYHTIGTSGNTAFVPFIQQQQRVRSTSVQLRLGRYTRALTGRSQCAAA